MKRSTVPVFIFLFFLFPNLTVGAGKPTLVSSSGSIAAATPTYIWNALPSATWYRLWVDDITGSEKINRWHKAADLGCASGTGTCSITPDGALADGARGWWVQAYDDAEGPWSDGMGYAVSELKLPKPVLLSPSGKIATKTPSYTWRAVPSATWYYLWVDDSISQPKVIEWYLAFDAGCGTGTGTCSITPDVVLAPGTGRWWVQAYNDDGDDSPWSDAMVFIVQAGSPPGKATLISPSGNISTANPAYTWNAVASSTWYLLSVTDSKNQEKINQWYAAADAGCGTGTGSCSATPVYPLDAGSYQWRIQTYSDYGWEEIYGPWSDAMSFTVSVGGPPGKATLVSPTGTITAATPAYTWNALPTAAGYFLFVSDSKIQGKINQSLKASDVGCSSGTGTCSYTPSFVLAAGACQWWIQAYNDYGSGPWSDAMSFTVSVGVPPGKAILVSPSGNIATATPTYTWNAVPTTTWYLLFASDSKTQGKINQWYKAADVGCPSGTGTCSYTPSTALAAGASQWWIQTWNEYGVGPWSDAMTFTVSIGGPPGKATLVSPTGTITTATPTYVWNAVATATRYMLYVNDSQTQAKINQSLKASDVGCSSGTGTCSYTPAIALAAGACKWWIQTDSNYGSGPWSDAMTFTVTGGIIGPHNIEFVTVLAGEFQMGSNNWNSNEQPVHRVIIGKSFQLGKYEITQGQWKAATGSNPSYFTGNDNLPVEQVSWDDAQAFITKLNALKDGYVYRLPTEAEWEYACRAGTTGDHGGTGNMDEMGWYSTNSGSKTHIVGTKNANAWGLYDMHGNVWEWVQDWYNEGYYSISPLTDPPGPTSGSARVNRGGSWIHDAAHCRSAIRGLNSPDYRYRNLGFRLLRTAQ